MTQDAQEKSTELTVAGRAAVALKAAERKQRFAELALQSAAITTVTNGDGYKECHAARMRLKTARIAVEKEGKEVRQDAVDFQKAVIALEAEIIGLIEPEEKRLQAIQDAWDERIAAEKEAAARAAREKAEAEERARKEAEAAAIREAQAEIERHKALLAEAEANRIKAEAEAAERIAKAEREAAERIAAAEAAARLKLELEERDARLAREEADRAARLKREAEQEAIRTAEAEAKRKKIIEDARIASENERIARERRELEEKQRRAREEEEAATKAERDRVEAEERKKRLEEQTTMDGMDLLRNFVAKYGQRREFLPIAAAINQFLMGSAGTVGQFVSRDETQG